MVTGSGTEERRKAHGLGGSGQRSEAEAVGVDAVAAPHLAHLLAPLLHQRLVLGDAQLLAVDDAGAFGSRPVAVVGVLLHVQLGQTRLLLVVRLLLRVRLGFPAST